MTNRRQFVIQITAASSLAGAAALAHAQTPALPMVADTDANAKALGYFSDGSKTDKVKYPKYAKEQNCSNCSLYQGKATDKAAACALFPGKLVAGKAWCSAWVKKA